MEESKTKGKYLIVLQAGRESHEGMARAVHALLYSKELKENGYEVALLFEGAGTAWVSEWLKPDSTDNLAPLYKELHALGVAQVICHYCAGAFQVKEELDKNKVPLASEYQGHPSIVKWIKQGFQVIIL